MAGIEPEGEKLRKAVRWISSELLDDSRKSIDLLIEQAALRFNLSPKEEEYLKSFYGKR